MRTETPNSGNTVEWQAGKNKTKQKRKKKEDFYVGFILENLGINL